MLTKCFLAAVLVFQACLASPFDLSPRITDGVDANPGEFPYQVSIQWGVPPILGYRHVCGGSIIGERYVLTAGHCILKIGKLRIVAGKHFMNKAEETEQTVNVVRSIVHKGYNGGVAQHDIAVLRLASPLTFNERVQPVQLPQQGEMQTGEAVLSGWGSISKNIRPKLPAVLQKAVLPILENSVCYKKLTSQDTVIGKKPELFETQICSDAVGEISACSGDSGGPLAQFVNGSPVQVGVVSWGFYPCGRGAMPSVYTRVASYVDWIKDNMEY
ncbi:hypothetical protein KM043_008426 [Ampulex compressa]|nr:hypothetical protein KM043_008426 [Ampulex compressa]